MILAFVFFAVATNNSFAAKSSYSQSITANPLGLAFGLLNATYEQQLSPNNSFTVSGYYFSITDWNAYGIGGSYRWYIDLFKTRQKPIEGFSVGPKAGFSFWGWDGITGIYDDGMTITIGGEALYKWVWDGFALEVGINLDFPVIKPKGLSGLTPFGLVAAVGYAW